MALDDRDRTFEKALARHLRSSASPSADALARPQQDSCPDSEILAAYHDGSLSLEERNLWKQHVLACDRCQFVLEHLQTVVDPPVNAEANEAILATNRPNPSGTAAPVARTARPKRPQSFRWLWLIPAGVAAAALVAYVSLRQPKPLFRSSSAPVEVAENRQPAPPTVSKESVPAPPGERKAKEESARAAGGAVGGVVSQAPALAPNGQRQQVQLVQQAPQQSGAAQSLPALKAVPKQQQVPTRVATNSIQEQEQTNSLSAQSAGSAGASAFDKKQQIPAPELPQSPAYGQPGFVADGAIQAPVTSNTWQAAQAAPAVPQPAGAPVQSLATPKTRAASKDAAASGSETVQVTTQAEAAARLRDANMLAPQVFGAPGGKVLWRAGAAGLLERSTDRGMNWTPQSTGVTADLLSGSSPSANVAWVVGKSGTILRTTDAGAHWTKLSAPTTLDLAGVHATDASHATIWFVPDQSSVKNGHAFTIYQTSDGGATWLLAPVS
jgi:hypothetical protein